MEPNFENLMKKIGNSLNKIILDGFDAKNNELLFIISKILKINFCEMKKNILFPQKNFEFMRKFQNFQSEYSEEQKKIVSFFFEIEKLKNFGNLLENNSYEDYFNFIRGFLAFRKNYCENFEKKLEPHFFILNQRKVFQNLYTKETDTLNSIIEERIERKFKEEHEKIEKMLEIFVQTYKTANFSYAYFQQKEDLEKLSFELSENNDKLAEILDLLKLENIEYRANLSEILNNNIEIHDKITASLIEFEEFILLNLNILEEKMEKEFSETIIFLDNFKTNVQEIAFNFKSILEFDCVELINSLVLQREEFISKSSQITKSIQIYDEIMANIPENRPKNKNRSNIEAIQQKLDEIKFFIENSNNSWNYLKNSFIELKDLFETDFFCIEINKIQFILDSHQKICEKVLQLNAFPLFENIVLKNINEIKLVSSKIYEMKFLNESYMSSYYVNLMFTQISDGLQKITLKTIFINDLFVNKRKEIDEILKIAKNEYILSQDIGEENLKWKTKMFFEFEEKSNKILDISNLSQIIFECKTFITKIEMITNADTDFSPDFKNFTKDSLNFYQFLLENLNIWKRFKKIFAKYSFFLNFSHLLKIDIFPLLNIVEKLSSLFNFQENNKILIYSYIFDANIIGLFYDIDNVFLEIKEQIYDKLGNLRTIFPRFYFINDEDLMNLISSFIQQERLPKHLISFIFPGARELIYDSESCIIGMLSYNNENFYFESKIEKNQKSICNILLDVEEEMKKTFTSMLLNSINIFPSQALENWIFSAPNQIIISSLHMIVSHEMYEMYRVVNLNKIKQSEVDDESNEIIEKLPESNENIQSSILQEQNIILNKMKKNPNVYFLKRKEEIEEMFGKNFDNEVFGQDKYENILLLQEKSFRGLLLRLQFWVNQIQNLLQNLKFIEEESRKIIDIENILLFVWFLRESVYGIYNKIGNDTLDEYEFRKHLKILTEPDTNNMIAECGGFFIIFYFFK